MIKQGRVNVVAYQYSLDLFNKVDAVEYPGEWLIGRSRRSLLWQGTRGSGKPSSNF